MMETFGYHIIWSNTAKSDLKEIYTFIKMKSPQGAKNVINDITKSTEHLLFSKQYQIEEYQPKCRRIIVRNYKILYEINKIKKEINIVRVFDTRQNPDKLENLKS